MKERQIRNNPRCLHLCYLRSKKPKSLKEAKSFSLAPMGAAPRKADSGNMVQKMPKSGAPENKKIVLCNIP